MTDYRILTAGDALAIPAEFDVAHWNVGRSGDLGGGVDVWTSWLPVQGVYETLVHLPDGDAIHAAYWRRFSQAEYTTRSREAALETHRATVQAVQAWLAEVTA